MLSKKCERCGETFFKTPNISLENWNTKRKFCSKHCANSRLYPARKGIKTHLWKKNVSIGRLHIQRRKLYGKPKKCKHCGATKKLQWANKSNKYKDVNDFISLCASCHKKYDNKANKRIVWNKGLKGEEYKKHYPKGVKGPPKGNIPWNKSNTYLTCPICKKEFHTNPSAVKAGKRFCSKECYWKSPAVKKGGQSKSLGGKWSTDFDKCILCGRIENKHQGRGLCVKCYLKQWYNKKHDSLV